MADEQQLNQAKDLLGEILPLTSGLDDYRENFVGERLEIHANLPFPIIYIDQVARVPRFEGIVAGIEGLQQLFTAARDGNVEDYCSVQLLQSLVYVVALINTDLEAIINGNMVVNGNVVVNENVEENYHIAAGNNADLVGLEDNNNGLNMEEVDVFVLNMDEGLNAAGVDGLNAAGIDGLNAVGINAVNTDGLGLSNVFVPEVNDGFESCDPFGLDGHGLSGSGLYGSSPDPFDFQLTIDSISAAINQPDPLPEEEVEEDRSNQDSGT